MICFIMRYRTRNARVVFPMEVEGWSATSGEGIGVDSAAHILGRVGAGDPGYVVDIPHLHQALGVLNAVDGAGCEEGAEDEAYTRLHYLPIHGLASLSSFIESRVFSLGSRLRLLRRPTTLTLYLARFFFA